MKNKLPIIGWMENRNGTPDISELEALKSYRDGCVTIGAKNCSGVVLRGGISAPIVAFMHVLRPYFEAVGYVIIRKEDAE